MKNLSKDQRGVVIAYFTVFFIVIGVALIWIIFNEVLLRAGEWATAYATESFGSTYNILIYIWRATPFVLLLGAIAWAILKAHQHSLYGG